MQAKGGSFVGDNKDFFRFRLGERAVIPAFEEAVQTMRVRARAQLLHHMPAGRFGVSRFPVHAACKLGAVWAPAGGRHTAHHSAD